MKRKPPVIALSWKGRSLVFILRVILSLIAVFKGRKWSFPLADFEENPRYFSLNDLAYFSFKYYHTQIRKAEEHSGTQSYFQSQEFETNDHSPIATVSLGGDLMPYDQINKTTCANLWDEVGSYFFSSDIVFANLETPIDLSRKPGLVPEVMLKEMMFNADLDIFNVFNGNNNYKGFDVLSVANNHSLDQGIEGLESTLKFLKNRNIKYCGAALTKDSLDDFPILNANGVTIAFIAFTFSLDKFELPAEDAWRCNHIRLNRPDVDISTIVRQASIARKRGADILIVSLHMGNAYQAYPSLHIQHTIHRICKEANADVIVGGHPHNPQPFEWFNYADNNSLKRKSLIFYSLGDFVAYDIYSWAHLSLLVKLQISKRGSVSEISGFEILPTYMTAELCKNKIKKLTFRHFDDVIHNKAHIDNPNIDISSVNELYSSYLMTKKQHDQIVVKSFTSS